MVGVIVNLAVFFAWHVFWPAGWTSGSPAGGLDRPSLAIGVVAATALFRFKANVIAVILACGAAGLAVRTMLPGMTTRIIRLSRPPASRPQAASTPAGTNRNSCRT